MIRLFYFSCLVLMIFHEMNAQQDLQWYVRDGKGKNSEPYETQYLNVLNGTQFSIEGVQHFGTNGIGGIPKNDIFIIYDENNNFNTHGSINAFNNRNTSYFGYNISTAYTPKFVYFSNLYETDDPPKRVKFHNGNTVSNPDYTPYMDPISLLGVTNTSDCLSLNQDFVVGKDVTLILNYRSIKNLIDNCPNKNSITLNYNSDVFNTSDIFDHATNKFAFVPTGITYNSGSININFNSTGNHTYNYLNFRVKDSKFTSATFSFVSPGCNSTNYPSVAEPISSSFHDPNYVKVLCTYKDNNGDFWVKYRIEAYNDGASNSRALVKFKFILPPSVDKTIVETGNWNHGGKKGCKESQFLDYTISKDTSFFIFKGVPEISGTNGGKNPNKCQKAWVEFCVKLNKGYNIETADLQPYYRYTNFSHMGVREDYPIEHFFDLDKKCSKNGDKEICIRSISEKCNCNCNQKRKILGIF